MRKSGRRYTREEDPAQTQTQKLPRGNLGRDVNGPSAATSANSRGGAKPPAEGTLEEEDVRTLLEEERVAERLRGSLLAELQVGGAAHLAAADRTTELLEDQRGEGQAGGRGLGTEGALVRHGPSTPASTLPILHAYGIENLEGREGGSKRGREGASEGGREEARAMPRHRRRLQELFNARK